MTQSTRKQGKHSELGISLLDEIYRLATTSLAEHHIAPDIADQTANHLRTQIALTWGGQLLYIPKDYQANISRRDHQIYAEFNGKNHSELATKYNITTNRIYDIVRQIRKNNQPDLFG